MPHSPARPPVSLPARLIRRPLCLTFAPDPLLPRSPLVALMRRPSSPIVSHRNLHRLIAHPIPALPVLARTRRICCRRAPRRPPFRPFLPLIARLNARRSLHPAAVRSTVVPACTSSPARLSRNLARSPARLRLSYASFVSSRLSRSLHPARLRPPSCATVSPPSPSTSPFSPPALQKPDARCNP